MVHSQGVRRLNLSIEPDGRLERGKVLEDGFDAARGVVGVQGLTEPEAE